MSDSADAVEGSYSVGFDGLLVVLVVDGGQTVVRVRLPADEARRMATLVLAACDVVDADDADEVIVGHRS